MEIAKWIPNNANIEINEECKLIFHNLLSVCSLRLKEIISKNPNGYQISTFVFTVLGSFFIHAILKDKYNLNDFPLEKVVHFAALYVIFDDLLDTGKELKLLIMNDFCEIIDDIENNIDNRNINQASQSLYFLKDHIKEIGKLFNSEVRSHIVEKKEPIYNEDNFQNYHTLAIHKSIDSVLLLFSLFTDNITANMKNLAVNMGTILQCIDDMGDFYEDMLDGTHTQAHICMRLDGNLDRLLHIVDNKLKNLQPQFKLLFALQFHSLSIHRTNFSKEIKLPPTIQKIKNVDQLLNKFKFSDCNCQFCNIKDNSYIK